MDIEDWVAYKVDRQIEQIKNRTQIPFRIYLGLQVWKALYGSYHVRGTERIRGHAVSQLVDNTWKIKVVSYSEFKVMCI
jgi:hypothetical protein